MKGEKQTLIVKQKAGCGMYFQCCWGLMGVFLPLGGIMFLSTGVCLLLNYSRSFDVTVKPGYFGNSPTDRRNLGIAFTSIGVVALLIGTVLSMIFFCSLCKKSDKDGYLEEGTHRNSDGTHADSKDSLNSVKTYSSTGSSSMGNLEKHRTRDHRSHKNSPRYGKTKPKNRLEPHPEERNIPLKIMNAW